MANVLYPKWKEALLNGATDSSLNAVGASGFFGVLLNAGYEYSAAHEFFGSVPVIAQAAPPLEIESVTVVNGIVNGDDMRFLSVADGALITALMLIRKNPIDSATWRLVAYLDTDVNGLPALPNGNDIIVNWHPTGIFGL